MFVRSTVALLAGLAAGVCGMDFNGTGQVRTLWSNGGAKLNGMDLGCLTVDGRWTIDEELCGVFSGVRTQTGTELNTAMIYLETASGPCGRNNVEFVCSDVAGLTSNNTPWIVSSPSLVYC
jgi:hypothetical protein